MANEHDPKPATNENKLESPQGAPVGPKGQKPPESPIEAGNQNLPEVPLEAPVEAADFDLAGLSDSDLPDAEALSADGEGIDFDLASPGIGDSERTLGISLADAAELASHLNAAHLSAEKITEVADAAPASEIIPHLEPEALACEIHDDVPVANAAPASEIIPHHDPEALACEIHDDVPVANAAPASEIIPLAEPEALAFEIHDDVPVANATPASEIIPLAEPEALAFEVQETPSSSDLFNNLEPLAPVEPASGWLDSQPGEEAAPLANPIDADLAQAASASGIIEGSDIFSGGSIPTALPKSDVSDVIAATAYSPAKPVKEEPSARIRSQRPSDVALTFDQPPGGSTIQDADADADLPMAADAELPMAAEAADSLFDDDIEPVDSARIAAVPPLPGENPHEADLGATPVGGIDQSSILAEFSEPGSMPGDSSAIRLESPGIEPSLRGGQKPGFANESTEDDFNLPGSGSGDPEDWREHSGSDLFGEAKPRSEFELLPDTGNVDPFADDALADQPSLSTAPSSIFSDANPPGQAGSGTSSGGSVPIANPDGTDSVEFSDHPDLSAADSGSFHALPAAALGDVDFNMTEELHPERSMRYEAPIEEGDWGVSETDPGPVSGILSRRPKTTEQTEELRPMAAMPVQGNADAPDDSALAVAWVDDSAEEEEPITPRSHERNREQEREQEPSRRGGRGLLGLAAGLLIGVGGAAGAYFSGILPAKTDGKSIASTGDTPPAAVTPKEAPPTVADAQAALGAGNPAKAVKVMETVGAKSPEEKAALGQARLFARLRELASAKTISADDAELKKARADLDAVVNDAASASTPEGEKIAVRAALHLGLTYEVAGDRAGALKVYALGQTKFPNSADAFQAALDRMAATDPDLNKQSHRLTPGEAEQLATAIVVLLAMDEVKPAAQAGKEAPAPIEAGASFWKAVNSATAGKYDEAVKQLAEAKKAHLARAKALAGRGLNPLTDPLEQIFPRCCDDLRAYWELRKALYEHPAVGAAIQKDGVAKTLATLATAEKRAVDAIKLAADLKKDNDGLATDLKAEKEKLAKSDKELIAEKEKTAKLDKDFKASEKTLVALKESSKKQEAELRADLLKRDQQLEVLKPQATRLKGNLDAIVKLLQGSKLLPEKFDDKALLAAMKSTVSQATKPPGHLFTLVARINKLDAAKKAIDQKLKEEVGEHAADVKKLVAASEAATKKLKLQNAEELKLAAEKASLDAKKAALAHAAEVKMLEAGIAAEKLRGLDAQKRFKVQLGDALSPTQQLDLWLEILVELRRPADADPALDAAKKALRSALPDSEDSAKAQTVAGLALILKNDRAGAKAQFEKALQSPAYSAAKGKGWAAVLDMGWASILDPASIARRPVEGGAKKDPLAAARNLDAGITAFKAGRFPAAEKALAEAAWHDPNDPIAWYFLGATHWAQGKSTDARSDFKQGADRESKRLIPTRRIDSALAPIQGPGRDALTAIRP